MSDLLFILATLVVLFLPGTVWLAWVRLGSQADPLERIAEAAGASLALTGVAALLLALVGIQLGAAGMVGLYLAVGLAGAAAAWLHRQRLKDIAGGWALLAVGAVLAVIAWRMYQARELVLPAWVDSVHHVLLVRKMFEYGGLPPDWLPYLNVPMYYHYGFHSLAAAFTFWSRLDPAQAVLQFGQVINAMVAFSVYRLAKAAWGDPLRAWLAALLTTFGFHMPAYYLTWGRYPMLAGLIVLPLAMAAALDVRRTPHDRSAWARLALLTAGVSVCHFLMVGLLGLFFLVLLSIEAYRLARSRSLRGLGWQPFAAAALGALLALPWLLWVWQNTHQMFAVDVPNPLDPANATAAAWEYIVYLTGPARSHDLLIAAGVGLLISLLRGRTRLIAAWGLLIAIMATPYGPKFEPFRPDHLAIVLFLPGSLLLGDLIVSLSDWLAHGASWLTGRVRARRASLELPLAAQAEIETLPAAPKPRFTRLILPLAVGLLLSAWGIWETRSIVNPVTVVALAADLPALDWAAQNTPADARFFINSTGWQGLYRGVDGGYWLLPAAGRYTVVLPAVYGFGSKEYILRQNDLARRAAEVKACDENLWSLVDDDRLDFFYVREGTGSLQPAALADCQGVEKIYEANGVFIYQIGAR